MANWYEPTNKDITEWEAWVASRPECVRVVAEKFKPWELYRLKTTNHKVTLVSIFEDGSLKVSVDGRFNNVVFSRHVFGVPPEDLEPCELPDFTKIYGALLTEEQDIKDFIDTIRKGDI